MAQTRRQIESDKKRALVLAKARQLFGECGYKALSMDRLAEQAGVSKGSVFAFYGTKQGLFAEVVGALLEEIIQFTATQKKPGASALESLETVFRAGFSFIQLHPQMYHFFSQQARMVVPEKLAEHKTYWIETFTHFLALAEQEGALCPGVNVVATGEAIYHLHKVLIEELFSRQDLQAVSGETLDAAIGMVLRGVSA